jgi:hypothetical protein
MNESDGVSMGNLIDRYVLGARVAPVVVVAFSLFLAVSAWIPFSEWPIKLLGGSVFLAIGAFVMAQLTRDAGKAIESPLWVSWGGPPSVRMLRHRDTTFAAGSKSLIHRRLVELHVVDHMPSADDERQNPDDADAIYRTCSDWLRRKALELKSKAPFDVVHSENISYGFRRNLLGIKAYGLAIAATALAVTVTAFLSGRRPFIELCAVLLVGAYLFFGVNAAAVKRAADEYAKRLLDAVQALSPT